MLNLRLRSLARSFLKAYVLYGLAVSMDSASDYLLLVFIIRIKGKCLEAGKTVHWSVTEAWALFKLVHR